MLNTVAEVIHDLLKDITEEEVIALRDNIDKDGSPSSEDPTENWHFAMIHNNLLRFIRNKYGLWQNNIELARDCLRINPSVATGTYRLWRSRGAKQEDIDNQLLLGEVHPDDASAVIKIELIRKLRERYAHIKKDKQASVTAMASIPNGHPFLRSVQPGTWFPPMRGSTHKATVTCPQCHGTIYISEVSDEGITSASCMHCHWNRPVVRLENWQM